MSTVTRHVAPPVPVPVHQSRTGQASVVRLILIFIHTYNIYNIYHTWKVRHPGNLLPSVRGQNDSKQQKDDVKLPEPTQNQRKNWLKR